MLLGFKTRFEPLIVVGEKRHTIRGTRRIAPRVGEICHCYVNPRQKSIRLLGRWPCVKVEPIAINKHGEVRVSGVSLDRTEKDTLAIRDGFPGGFAEMLRFWEDRLPFVGQIIHWDYDAPVGRPGRAGR